MSLCDFNQLKTDKTMRKLMNQIEAMSTENFVGIVTLMLMGWIIELIILTGIYN